MITWLYLPRRVRRSWIPFKKLLSPCRASGNGLRVSILTDNKHFVSDTLRNLTIRVRYSFLYRSISLNSAAFWAKLPNAQINSRFTVISNFVLKVRLFPSLDDDDDDDDSTTEKLKRTLSSLLYIHAQKTETRIIYYRAVWNKCSRSQRERRVSAMRKRKTQNELPRRRSPETWHSKCATIPLLFLAYYWLRLVA